jgi:D-alanine-D-alanine ligase
LVSGREGSNPPRSKEVNRMAGTKKIKARSMDLSEITYREDPCPMDAQQVREIVVSSGFFSKDETDVAVELVEERLRKGLSSGYYFVFAEKEKEVIGYACFGPIPCTVGSYDLYWIAVKNVLRGSGLGREILHRVEQKVMAWGGKRIYMETSSKQQYRPTHAFYKNCGYRKEAVLRDFYSPGDHKMIFLKEV